MHADQASEMAVVASPTTPVVPGSRFCITCGYQLSGLPLDGVCPECSTRVELSLTRLSLLTDPIEHVRTLRRGALRLMVGTLLFLGGPLFLIPLGFFAAGLGADSLDAAIFAAMQFAAASVTIWGARGYTQENPDTAIAKLLEVTRIAVLLPSMALFGFSALGMSLTLAFAASSDGSGGWAVLITYVFGVLAWLFMVPGVISYTAKLAARVPDRRLEKRAESLKVPIVILLLLGVATWGIASFLGVLLYLFVIQRMHWQLGRIIAFRASKGA